MYSTDLGVISSQISQNEINNIMNLQNDWKWIGLTDSITEGVWLWVDGRNTSNYVNWAGDIPSEDSKDCGYVFLNGSTLWVSFKFIFVQGIVFTMVRIVLR